MTAAVTNDWTVTYAGLTVGGTTDYLLKGPVKLSYENTNDRTQRRASLEATVVLAHPTEATFVAALAALKRAFSTKRQSLVVLLGATTVLSAVPGSDSGFNASASAVERDADLSTGRSREVEIRVEAELPTTFSGGLSNADFEVSTSPSGRRTVTITGCYNAVTPNGALAVYYANSYAYSAAFLATLPDSDLTSDAGEFQIVVDDPTPDVADKVCPWRQVWEETVVKEAVSPSPGPLVDADLVQMRLDVDRQEIAEGDAPLEFYQPNRSLPRLPSGVVTKPAYLTLTYDAWVRSTNLTGKWDSKIKPWLISTLRSYTNGQFALVELRPVFDERNNRVSATARAIDFRGSLYALDVSVEEDRNYGAEIDSLLTGNPLDAVASQFVGVVTRVVTRRSSTVGPSPISAEATPSIVSIPSSGWIPKSLVVQVRQERIGISPNFVVVTKTLAVEAFRYVTGGGAGGSGVRSPSPGGSGFGPGVSGPSPTSSPPSSGPDAGSSSSPDGPSPTAPPEP